MATITFKAKKQKMGNMDGTLAYEYVSFPILDRKHCDMQEFRQHTKYGPYANSDLFKGMLAGIRKDLLKGEFLRLDTLPSNVSLDDSGFLAVITIKV